MENYKTILRRSQGEYKEKGSRFIGYVVPMQDKLELKSILQSIKEEHPSARHLCYAYKVGWLTKEEYRINDDGEPSGSAGKPIFGQIQSFELTNCFIGVIRYFGGTKLGVGGLITAYKQAAKESVLANTIITKEITVPFTFLFPYSSTAQIESIIKRNKLLITEKSFESICKITVQLPVNQEVELVSIIKSIVGVSMEDK